MIYFLDSNVILYAVGKEHLYREPCAEILRKSENEEIELIISTEIIQEILYFYSVRNLRSKGLAVAEKVIQITREILSVDRIDIEKAMELMQDNPPLKPRDAIHAAVMLNHDSLYILSADADFDQLPQIQRIDPLKFEEF
ncbi:MAG: type II toxin-antitoxin system VapC family toxin [Deltaproteobacteria bacterium]|nr:type II toxin-antitoxin system VapC family toxin [Deltaproteobacteria bacterium]